MQERSQLEASIEEQIADADEQTFANEVLESPARDVDEDREEKTPEAIVKSHESSVVEELGPNSPLQSLPSSSTPSRAQAVRASARSEGGPDEGKSPEVAEEEKASNVSSSSTSTFYSSSDTPISSLPSASMDKSGTMEEGAAVDTREVVVMESEIGSVSEEVRY